MSEDKPKLLPMRGPAVHIAPEHQSAPKETWADKEVRKAAEEIDKGQFKPVFDEDDALIAVGIQRGDLPHDPNDIDTSATMRDLALAQHPRVQEALARMEKEKREAKTSQEAIEKSQMLFELNEMTSAANRWKGQGRWEGKESEESRIGLILSPFGFMERLERVCPHRVMMSDFAVSKRVALMVQEKAAPAPLIIVPGAPQPRKDGLRQVATLQYPCSTEFMVMRFDEYGVPTTAKYLGWRTALLCLIREGIITEKEAHKAFPLGTGPAANWYREQLQVIRSERGIVN